MAASVLIVGAGPTGLMLALQLARRGVAFDLIDAAEHPGEASRAIAVHARTLEFYDQLGLADMIMPLGAKVETFRIRSGGRDVATLPLGDIGAGSSRFPYVFSFAQDDHERFLIAQLAAVGIEVARGRKVVALVQHDDRVAVTIEVGGEAEKRDYAWVCGCDGAHSAVRHALGTTFDGGTYEGVFFVADVEIDGARRDEIVANLASRSFVLKMPVRADGGTRLVGNVLAEDEAVTFAALQPEVERLVGAKVARLNWFSTYKVHHRVAASFRDRRCFLLGDAGHLHSPAGGQGMNTGIGDAVNLAWKLASVIAGADPALLDTYNAERLPFARQLVATTDRVFSLITGTGVAGRLLRSAVVPNLAPMAMRLTRVRRAAFRAVSQIALAYPDSALSDGHSGAIRAGDRLPWVATLDNFAPLRALDWHVQVHGEVGEDLATALLARGVSLHRYAWDAPSEEAGFARNVPYLVRPDGYVAVARPDPPGTAVLVMLDRWRPQPHGLTNRAQ